MSDAWATLASTAVALGLWLPEDFESRARVYLEELARWSRVGRLTGYRTEAERVERLVLDSLRFLPVLSEPASPLLDIGSGAGIPGLILNLARPEWAVTLVEASRRRANFLRHVGRRLDLGNLRVEAGRAESLAADPALVRQFRAVTLRAVADPGRAAALAAPFVAGDGRVVVPLGPRTRAAWDRGQVIEVPRGSGLPRTRAFLIIPAAELAGFVPRGTRRGRGSRPGDREPEGGRGQDHDRREPGGGLGGCRAPHPPRRC